MATMCAAGRVAWGIVASLAAVQAGALAQEVELIDVWDFSSPGGPGMVRIGPDGNLYWYNEWTIDYLHKVSPSGELLWRRRGGDFTFSPDGQRIYHEGFGSGGRALHAIDLDGNTIWSFQDFDSGVLGFSAGPTVGPDGNIYGVTKKYGTSGGGYAFSITPDGDMRWRIDGFNQLRIAPATELTFSDTRVHFAEPVAPGTRDGGVLGVSMETAEVEWIYPYAGSDIGTRQLRETPDGHLSAAVYQISAEGEERWFINAGGSTGGPGEIQLDAQGNMYYVNGGRFITSVDPEGNIRWNVYIVEDIRPPIVVEQVRRIALSPDGRYIAYTGWPCFSASCNGRLVMRRTIDGSLVFNVPLPDIEGEVVSPDNYRPTFTPDSKRLYVPVYDFASTTRGWMLTFCIEDGCDTCLADLDGDGELSIFDFLAFQNLFDAGDPSADFDGDGELTIFDFLAFQNEFDAGC